jgi:argininosuccinate synthase
MVQLVKEMIKLDLNWDIIILDPNIKIIAPWRIWKLKSRTDLINYAKKHGIAIPKDKKGAPPFSIDDNLFHTSTEGKSFRKSKKFSTRIYFSKNCFT